MFLSFDQIKIHYYYYYYYYYYDSEVLLLLLLLSLLLLLLKCDSFFFYKVRWSVLTKCDSFFITKCNNYYYKVEQLLQSVTILLQSVTGITKCDDYESAAEQGFGPEAKTRGDT